ncbi:AAA family ATPase [Methylocapsa aurea]|uniref:bifunctional aminoglycoside phosphotransferase/ATP-binding protein n=1 Tax=Methylocapsa aurea TaxID=663610 RepID=UPI000569BC7C|nr:bifunctional aminoglycoside phosphotransferase/ATP-binding protein [Methylocapsa aurea]
MESHVLQDQSEIFAFLGNPATHGLAGPVIRVDTHGAAVFLAGRDVYKIKRAVRFPFMDFSTLDKRRRACESELAVNKANAPEIYLGVTPISKDQNGLKLGAGGTIVEWAVHLRRFDENRTLDHLADRGELDSAIIAKLADVVAAAHRRARPVIEEHATLALQAQIEETLLSLEAAPDIFPPQGAALLRNRMTRDFERLSPLLSAREDQGLTRRCHGDLHLRNIAMIDAAPVLFDALEFDEKLATCDLLYDLGFLLMDLWTRGLRAHANLLFNRYLSTRLEAANELDGLAALPLFLSLRAAIRAKVTALQPARDAGHIAAARRLFESACDFLEPAKLELIAIGGLSGTGKSSLARALSPSIGRAPGALHLRSDIERKRLYGLREFDRLPDEAYRPEISAKIYERLRNMAAVALAAGQSVVIDAAHLKAAERLAEAYLAGRRQAYFTGLWLEAPTDVLFERVARRKDDASDATQAVVAAQAQEKIGAMDWERLDASASRDSLIDHALASIRRSSPSAPQ